MATDKNGEYKMKVRKHRQDLDDSMATQQEVSTVKEFVDFFQSPYFDEEIKREAFSVKRYCFDDRINQESYIVTVPGWGVLGWTDGPMEGLADI